MVVNFEDYMLEDASKWSDLTDVGRSVEPYNDPLLSSRSGYIDFLSKLYSSGVLNFSDQCRGRVGAFCVAKKPKMVNGETIMRQRLVLDCRQTNLVFKTPPHTRLGSLSALADAELPDGSNLYVAGADIRDCFYAVHMETGLQQFFGLKWNVTGEEVSRITKGQHSGFGDNTVPVIQVLPMGFSWSFFLVQHLHSEVALRSLGLDEKFFFLMENHHLPSRTQRWVSCLTVTTCIASPLINRSAKLQRIVWWMLLVALVSICMSMLRPALFFQPWVELLMVSRVRLDLQTSVFGRLYMHSSWQRAAQFLQRPFNDCWGTLCLLVCWTGRAWVFLENSMTTLLQLALLVCYTLQSVMSAWYLQE